MRTGATEERVKIGDDTFQLSVFEVKEVDFMQWWASAMNSSLFSRALIFVCEENKGAHSLIVFGTFYFNGAFILNSLFNATGH
jgi:hypothetical protein